MEAQTGTYSWRQLSWRRRLICVPAAMLLILPSQAQDRIKALTQERMKVSAAAVEARREALGTAAALIPGLVNEGTGFQLICRGGPGLRIGSSDVRPAPAAYDLPPWILISTMTVDFIRSPQPPDRSGRNLQPGHCSPAGFPLRGFDPTQIRSNIVSNGQWKRGRDGLPEDNAPNVAERYPDAHSITGYLKDPNHYWSFLTSDAGEGHFQSADSRYWKPEFYKGPATSTSYPSTAPAAALAGRPATTIQATSSRFGGIGMRTEGHAGTPAVPSPAAPTPPPPIMVVPDPALPVVFSPPLLDDGAQLWACAGAVAGDADPEACSGEASAQAYCQLRDAQSGPDLLIANAQPGMPVRAVNDAVCPNGDACRVVSELQCDR